MFLVLLATSLLLDQTMQLAKDRIGHANQKMGEQIQQKQKIMDDIYYKP